VTRRGPGAAIVLAALLMLLASQPPSAHGASKDARLSKIGPAPAFALTTQDGTPLTLDALRGKVVVVTFIYTGCADTCPLLTARMATLQARLGPDFGPRVFFLSVTVDPERDTPDVLKRYAAAHRANPAGWAFLTGTPAEVADVGRRYGIFARKAGGGGDVDHTFLTSMIDQEGVLRVQYMGVRFDPAEFLRDVRSLLREARTR
jgi:protein SCO1